VNKVAKEQKFMASRGKILNILHEVEEMREDLECDGKINSNYNGNRTGQCADNLKCMMIRKNNNYIRR
jgi:hypothetical protein